jgi:chromosome segregation ATPase
MCASRTLILAFAALLTLQGAAQAVAADKKNDPSKEQVRRLQQANRKLEQEKSELTREKAAVEEKLKAAEEETGAAKGRVASASRRSAALEKDLDATRSEKEVLAGKLAESEKHLAATAERLRREEGERKRLEALVAEQKQSIGQCESLNAKLHDQGLALLNKYQGKGCLDSMLQGEPFTGLKQVEVENFMEDSRDKLDSQRFIRQMHN